MFLSISFFLILIHSNNAFIPATLLDNVFNKVDKLFLKTLDVSGETTTHDDIIKYGVIESIVQYFYNQTNGSTLVNLTKSNNEYYDLTNLYKDYYKVTICDLEAKNTINNVLKLYVALVDLDPKTKDMPYAHFDAETFINSNQRVIDFTKDINTALDAKDYSNALKLSGIILHTIQDFYSHSNWVEKGEIDINYSIGNTNFSQLQIIGPAEGACLDNCNLITIECGKFLTLVANLIQAYNSISSSSQFQLIQCWYITLFFKTNSKVFFYFQVHLTIINVKIT
jgi:hypothetical protein